MNALRLIMGVSELDLSLALISACLPAFSFAAMSNGILLLLLNPLGGVEVAKGE